MQDFLSSIIKRFKVSIDQPRVLFCLFGGLGTELQNEERDAIKFPISPSHPSYRLASVRTLNSMILLKYIISNKFVIIHNKYIYVLAL